MRLTLTFDMPFSKVSPNLAAFAADLASELMALTQLPGSHVLTTSVREGSVVAVCDVFFDVALLRTYAEATTFAMNAQVCGGLGGVGGGGGGGGGVLQLFHGGRNEPGTRVQGFGVGPVGSSS